MKSSRRSPSPFTQPIIVDTPAPVSEAPREASTIDTARPDIGQDRVAARAHEIWEKEGRQEGHDQEHWFQAERELTESAGARSAARRR